MSPVIFPEKKSEYRGEHRTIRGKKRYKYQSRSCTIRYKYVLSLVSPWQTFRNRWILSKTRHKAKMKFSVRGGRVASILFTIALSIIVTTCLSEGTSKPPKRSSIPLSDYFERDHNKPTFSLPGQPVESFISVRNTSSRISMENGDNELSLVDAERLLEAANFSRISGGSSAPFQLGLHTVFLAVQSADGGISGCSGTILDKSRILTAAHCFLNRRSRFSVRRVVLRKGRFVGSGTIYAAKYVDVFKFYHPPSAQNDVAIVWLTRDFSKPYKPVILPPCSRCWAKPLAFLYAAGYGQTRQSGPVSRVLRHTQLRVRPYNVCMLKYFQITRNPVIRFFSNVRMVCAMDPRFPKVGQKSVCKGDSGGPLYFKRPNGILQVGISSFGGGACSKAGSVQWFVNLPSYTPSIKQYLNKKYAHWIEIYRT